MSQEASRKCRRGLVLYESNPFVAVLVGTKARSDSARFVKLYAVGAKALRTLTSAGTKVFEVLYLEVRKPIIEGKIYMSFGLVDHVSNPMSKATFMRGMRDLIEKGFLAETMLQGWFWLNPDYIWNGDRLAFVKEYRKKLKGMMEGGEFGGDIFEPLS